MANFIKVSKMVAGAPLKEKTWINSDKIIKFDRTVGETIITMEGGSIGVEETPEEIIKKINWSEAKKRHIVSDLLSKCNDNETETEENEEEN